MRYASALILFLAIISCTTGEMASVTRIAVTGDINSAQQLAAQKAVGYAVNPKTLDRDIKQFEKSFAGLVQAFRKTVEKVWGAKEIKEPKPTTYVKYIQNFYSRATVDFDNGLITVETLDKKAPLKSLEKAIVTTLLTPDDPRAVDLYSAKPVKLGQTPFLFDEVRDHKNQSIRWAWRAEQFAAYLIENKLQKRKARINKEEVIIYYITFPMVRDHLQIRALKYRLYVERFSKHFSVSKNLVYAIMKTESDFNPYAVSNTPAFGLMQIVPATAGRDVNIFLNRKGVPSDRFLLKPENNIHYGAAYLHLLYYKYFHTIDNPVSREYCVIAAYNTGAGNVLRTFHHQREQASKQINSIGPLKVLTTLRNQLPYYETRRYLAKVLEAKKDFVY